MDLSNFYYPENHGDQPTRVKFQMLQRVGLTPNPKDKKVGFSVDVPMLSVGDEVSYTYNLRSLEPLVLLETYGFAIDNNYAAIA